MNQRACSQTHSLVVKERHVELSQVVRERSPLCVGDIARAGARRTRRGAAATIELIDCVARKSATPLEDGSAVRPAWKMRRRIGQTPNPRECATERLRPITNGIVSKTVIPVVVIEIESIPSPVDEGLPTNSWPIKVIAGRVQVWYRVSA